LVDRNIMDTPLPYFQEAGAGPGVVCLHSNASHSNQWRALMQALSPAYRVLAADSYGAGRSPDWTAKRPLRLADEVALLEPVFARAGDPFVLVGHSYGGAVALMAALAHPQRVSALVLYEPTLFALIDAATPAPNEADGIRRAVTDAGAALDAGDKHRAAECFIDFWMGAGAWQRTPDPRKPAIAESVVHVRRWGRTLFGAPAPLGAFARLTMPVLFMTGRQSPAASLGVARLLAPVLSRVERIAFDGMGHMGPITHPQVVNETIARFLVTTHRAVGGKEPAAAAFA
jgi:pimeloyl-ACP methyl ester carboxylesterase